ncbi:ParB N-terminal domain-containing protein [Candidatus Aerophobetes bacterium]|nr:ParB N-terminal domain-containing protein [Candidatus Aerophobetes bacterium]
MLKVSEEKPLKCFEAEYKAKKFPSRIDRGIQAVEIEKIVGSVSRCLDFDREFSVKNKGSGQHIFSRMENIKRALEKGKSLPAVELYKMDDEYYVVDGHHRIAAAKGMGQKFIDAHVVEYLPSAKTSRGALIRKRTEFELKTGLQGIELSQKDDYDKLLSQIHQHKDYLEQRQEKELSLQETARDWFQTVYFPIIREIKKADLNFSEYLPHATLGDIYVYLCDEVNMFNARDGNYGVSVEEALEELGILTRATKLIFQDEGFKEKLLKLLSPCYYLKRCPFGLHCEM